MGVFKLRQRLWKLEITDAHVSSLTVEFWIYKGWLIQRTGDFTDRSLQPRRRALETRILVPYVARIWGGCKSGFGFGLPRPWAR